MTGSGRPRHPFFTWASIALGNIKSAAVGTCRGFYGRHSERTLVASEWRFDLAGNAGRLAGHTAEIMLAKGDEFGARWGRQ